MHVGKLVHDRTRVLMDGVGLHRGQGRVMHALSDRDELSQSELADVVHVTPATLSAMLKRMESQGLVGRSRDSHDDRVVRVRLTARGREVKSEAHRIWTELEQELTAGFTPRELSLLHRCLCRIRHNLGGTAEAAQGASDGAAAVSQDPTK
jgi:DNA-binding MarR family transcriptional regulator